MSKQCNCPSHDDLVNSIKKCIAKGHYQIIHVARECDDEPSFAYTVGLHSLGQPELLVIGLDNPRIAHTVLTIAAEKVDAKCNDIDIRIKDAVETTHGNMDLRLVELDTKRAALRESYAIQCYDFYRRNPEAIRFRQVYWPDIAGNFQDEPAWTGGITQTLLSKAYALIPDSAIHVNNQTGLPN